MKPRGFPSGKIYIIVIEKKLYTTGGVFISDHLQRRSINEAHVYLFKDNNTTLMAPMNSRRFFHGCCSYAGHLFVCGGKDGEPSTCCEKLIIKDNKWIFVAEMNEARRSFQVVACGKHVWAIGGSGLNGVLNTAEYYYDIIDKWKKSSPMIQKRRGHSAVASRGNIYVIGGSDGFRDLNSAEKLDTRNKQWTLITSMEGPRVCFATAINEYKLFCFGGNFDDIQSVVYFDLYNEVWIEEERMDINRDINGYFSAVTVYDV